MNNVRSTISTSPVLPAIATWRDWLTLTKPEITFLVTISALAGFVLASPDGINGWTLLWAMIGIPLTSAGGCAMNQVMEHEFDAGMKRTATRPIPSGRIRVDHARWYSLALIGAGLGILCPKHRIQVHTLSNPYVSKMAWTELYRKNKVLPGCSN